MLDSVAHAWASETVSSMGISVYVLVCIGIGNYMMMFMCDVW